MRPRAPEVYRGVLGLCVECWLRCRRWDLTPTVQLFTARCLLTFSS